MKLELQEINEAQIAFGVATTQTEIDGERRWWAIKHVSEFLGRLRLAAEAEQKTITDSKFAGTEK